MLYSFGRFLIPHLDRDEGTPTPHPEREVELQYYRIEKVTSGVVMEDGDAVDVKSPTAWGQARRLMKKSRFRRSLKR